MLAIKTQGLTKVFAGRRNIRAVDNLNLEINTNEIFGFLGPNGAGKTTTINLLLGLFTPTSGSAWILGEEIGSTRVKQKIGFLPENPYFYDYLTAREYLDFFGKIFQLGRTQRREKIDELLELVGLRDADRLVLRKFSRGMLQRIGIAQALINDPELVFLDEPITGLDPVGRKEIREIVQRIKKDNRTVFFCSHVLHDVELMCDHVGILCRGKLIRTGWLNELLKVKQVDISVRGLSGEVIETLEKKAKHIVKESDKVTISVDNSQIVPEIVTILKEKGGIDVSIDPHKKSLEELFLETIEEVERNEHHNHNDQHL